jgi:hypothetical protein
MTYICIKCRMVWVNGSHSTDLSGGLCLDCVTEYIRSRQRKRGLKDCFRRGETECLVTSCTYQAYCMNHSNAATMSRSGEEDHTVERLVA